MKTTQLIKCYVSVCDANGTQITITLGDSTTVDCTTPNSLVTVPGYDWAIKCPSSFEDFCAV
jgi:hypothetical protein